MEDNKPTKKYNEMVAPRIEEIRAWARDGVTEEEMSKRLGIAYSTFKEYKKRYSAILDAIKKGKERYDNEVVDALHKNTLGGIVVLKKTIKLKKRFFESDILNFLKKLKIRMKSDAIIHKNLKESIAIFFVSWYNTTYSKEKEIGYAKTCYNRRKQFIEPRVLRDACVYDQGRNSY